MLVRSLAAAALLAALALLGGCDKCGNWNFSASACDQAAPR
jgi:hypothetical protein